MDKIKKWYNKMLVEKYGGRNIDLLSEMGEKRPFLFCLPLYSPSLYTYYDYEKIQKEYFDEKSEMEKIKNEMAKDEKIIALSKEFDIAFIDDNLVLKRKG